MNIKLHAAYWLILIPVNPDNLKGCSWGVDVTCIKKRDPLFVVFLCTAFEKIIREEGGFSKVVSIQKELKIHGCRNQTKNRQIK
jgi:hypothetical protein